MKEFSRILSYPSQIYQALQSRNLDRVQYYGRFKHDTYMWGNLLRACILTSLSLTCQVSQFEKFAAPPTAHFIISSILIHSTSRCVGLSRRALIITQTPVELVTRTYDPEQITFVGRSTAGRDPRLDSIVLSSPDQSSESKT